MTNTQEYQVAPKALNLGANSRYTNNPLFIASSDLILNTFERRAYQEQADDTYYTVQGDRQFRLDLISQDSYGTTELWWLIAWANQIVDPFTEVTVGVRLIIPPKSEVNNR